MSDDGGDGAGDFEDGWAAAPPAPALSRSTLSRSTQR